jgi:hypothetical protein
MGVRDMEKKEITQIGVNQDDILKDINDIKELLEERTGMKLTGCNVIRACIKAWYDLNNNG